MTSRCASWPRTPGSGWPRCAQALPEHRLQMLLRGRNTVGYTPYPEAVTDAFVAEAASAGIDIFRIFDALNDVDQMRPAIDAVRATGTAVAEVALCYTARPVGPGEKLYTLDYYLRLAEKIVEAGAHVLAIKDMAGLLRARPPQRTWSRPCAAVRPARAPAHPRHRRRPAGHPAGRRRRRGGRRRRGERPDGRHHLPAVRCRRWSRRSTTPSGDTGLAWRAVSDLEPYWEAVRGVYAPFESGLPAPTGRVYRHEIPGGQLSNLRQQAIALGLGEKFEAIEDMYAAADAMLGRLVKVTPSSKVVGDLALHLVGVRRRPGGLRGRTRQLRHPGLGHRFPLRRARRPAGRLAGTVPHQGPGRAGPSRSRDVELSRRGRAALDETGRRAGRR